MTLRHRLLVGLTLSSTALLVVAACGPGLFDGLTGGDAGTASTPTGEVCTPEIPPAAPTSDDAAELPELYFTFDEIKIDTLPSPSGGLAAPTGFDLDGLCSTCSADAGGIATPPSCTVARSAATAGGPAAQCDQANGRENNLGSMFNTLLSTIPQATTDFATQKIREGVFTVIVDVKGWNGTDDDPNVSVTVYGSQGLAWDDGGTAPPAFDGADTWSLDPASLFQGDAKIGLDCRKDVSFCTPLPGRTALAGGAYVTGGTLVAKFGSVPLTIGTNVGNLVFDLDVPQLVAKIRKDETGRYRLEGQFVGRWPVAKALPAIASLSFPDLTGKVAPLCTNTTFYTVVKTVVCSEPDLPVQVDGGASAPCGSMSSAIAFKASNEARPSVVYQRTDGGGPCAAFTDTCPP